MLRDPDRRFDGQMDIPQGVDSGVSPSQITKQQVSFALNVTFRDKFPTNRPPYKGLYLTYESTQTQTRFNSGAFQAGFFYQSESGNSDCWLIMRGGRLFRVDGITLSVAEITPYSKPVKVATSFTVPAIGISVSVVFNDVGDIAQHETIVLDEGSYYVNSISGETLLLQYLGGAANAQVDSTTQAFRDGAPLFTWDVNPSTDMFAYIFAAENYAIVLQGTQLPIIYDGTSTRRSKGDPGREIPPGYVGAYINGRIWLALPNRRFYVAGDIVGDRSSGSQQHDYRDSVLKFTSNTYLNEGGSFSTLANNGLITAIIGSTQIDTSMGQGPVCIFTERSVFTNQAPVDAATWKDLAYPIQTVADTDYGALSPRSVVNVNSDTWYRSEDGVRSFIIARRNFNAGWGNTPMSQEMDRIIRNDSVALLSHCSAVVHDNRLLVTCSPSIGSDGVFHRGIIALNFDEVSGMFNKTAPAWEGLWTGLDVFQLVKGRQNNIECAWAICKGTDGSTEIWQLATAGDFDSYDMLVGGKINRVTKPVQCFIETRSFNFGSGFELKKLLHPEIYVDWLQGTVNFDLRFRPDQYPCWIQWYTWSECNNNTNCNEQCGIPVDYKPGYRPLMRTPPAPETCLPSMGVPGNLGYEFQLRLGWTGKTRIKQIRLHAKAQLDIAIGECR